MAKMPRPVVQFESSGLYARPIDGSGKTPLLAAVDPDRPIGGVPGPKALGATLEESLV
jgi:hypothetical protein